MNLPAISCDVDYTLVDLTNTWWKWLEGITGCKKDMATTAGPGLINYDLGHYFKDELEAVGRDSLDFYRQTGLYDTLQPNWGSVAVLEKLAKAGYQVVFTSSIKGNHSKSKYYFLKRHYPTCIETGGVVYTKEKQFVPAEVFIDDRAEHVNKSNCPIKILFNAGFDQYEPLKQPCKIADHWIEIEVFLSAYFSTKN